LYAPVPGTFFDSFPTSNGSFLTDLLVDIPVFFFNFNSASLISYSPTPGFPLFEEANLGTVLSI
jgi:hypothetical protein